MGVGCVRGYGCCRFARSTWCIGRWRRRRRRRRRRRQYMKRTATFLRAAPALSSPFNNASKQDPQTKSSPRALKNILLTAQIVSQAKEPITRKDGTGRQPKKSNQPLITAETNSSSSESSNGIHRRRHSPTTAIQFHAHSVIVITTASINLHLNSHSKANPTGYPQGRERSAQGQDRLQRSACAPKQRPSVVIELYP